jgi:hypothetical protein
MSGKIIFPAPAPLLGWESTKLGNGAIPGTSGNPEKSLKLKYRKIQYFWKL